MPIDTERTTRTLHALDMSNDIEIELCNGRGRGDEMIRLVEEVTHHGRGLHELVTFVLDEIDTARNRWTPYYDRALALVVDHHDVLRRYVDDKASIIGFSAEDLLPINIRWELDQHGRACDFLDRALANGARFLSEAWPYCTTRDEAVLALGLLPDPRAMIEPIRQLVLTDLIHSALGATSRAYLDAAMAASLGAGSWDAVELVYVRWADEHAEDWNTYDGGIEEHLTCMSRVPRKNATLDDVCYGLRAFPIDRIKRDLGNPFAPLFHAKLSCS